MNTITQIVDTDDATSALLKGSVLLKAEENAHKRTASKLDTTQKLLAKFLDEFEGKWDSDEQCASPEIAQDYLDAAVWMRDNFGRRNNRIRQVEDWVNDFLPFGN